MSLMYVRSAAMFAALNVTSKVGTTGNTTAPSLGVPDNVQHLWAQYTPWFSEDGYKSPPDGCDIVQVCQPRTIACLKKKLQRHGARYPEQAAADSIQKSVEKIKGVQKFTNSALDFVTTYNYSLGVSDLVPFGAAQSFDAGQDHYTRYVNLVNDTMLPFVRASNSERVIASANNWTSGFAQANRHKYSPKLSVIISQTGNDTLDNKMCPADTGSKKQTSIWAETYATNMAANFNYAAPGASLNSSDVVNFIALCAFDTVPHEKASPWCNLFSEDNWSSFEYYGDLDTYYLTGYGQKLGRVQGVAYVNELLARLNGQHVQDKTQSNHTLDNSPATFPLNRTFYADFTHDNEMIAIYSALGLFNKSQDLDPKKPDSDRTWIVSRMVPFSARMITEKLTCKGKGSQVGDEYVRVLVNDVVQRLGFCDGDADGLCSLSKFVESQEYPRENGKGDWELCFKPSKANGAPVGNVGPEPNNNSV